MIILSVKNSFGDIADNKISLTHSYIHSFCKNLTCKFEQLFSRHFPLIRSSPVAVTDMCLPFVRNSIALPKFFSTLDTRAPKSINERETGKRKGERGERFAVHNRCLSCDPRYPIKSHQICISFRVYSLLIGQFQQWKSPFDSSQLSFYRSFSFLLFYFFGSGSQGGNYHICGYGMCHFLGCLFSSRK